MKISVHTYTDGVTTYETGDTRRHATEFVQAMGKPETKWLVLNVVGGSVMIRTEDIYRIEMTSS